MSEPASQIIEYFLGIEGEQKGPFSKDEISTMLSNGQISNETPLWCSGMSDWTPVGNLELFKKDELAPSGEFKSVTTEPILEPKPKGKVTPVKSEFVPEAAEPTSDKVYETVFSDSVNFKASDSTDKTSKTLLIGAVVLIAAAMAYWGLFLNSRKTLVVTKTDKMSPTQARKLALSKLQVQFNKNPNEAIPELITMVKENPKDNVGLEALETVLSYYRRQQNFSEAGKVLLAAKNPLEALSYFLKDPPDYAQADLAYEEAYNQGKGQERRDLIIKQIDILIGKMGNIEKAISRVRVLEKEFPGTPHPFQYYLKTTEQRIADIFSRISFYYSESLNTFITGELAQLQFEGKPLLQITKDKAGKYRIVATYKGAVNLRNEPVPNVFFVFWLANEQWSIVDTNLTKERAKFAKEEQKKHEADLVTAEELLQNLESIFKTQFPGKGLHEVVTPPKRQPVGAVE